MPELVFLEISCQLSPEEESRKLFALPAEVQARARRYLSPKARQNLVATQWVLHQILNRLQVPEDKLKRCPNGRPFLEGEDLQFNLSHTEQNGVLVLARDVLLDRALGVDIENLNRQVDTVALAKRFFTEEEARLSIEEKRHFFRVWTRKEAVLKSNGIGLRVPLDSFDVLSDQVGPELTGVSLNLDTRQLDNGCLVSWATPSHWNSSGSRWVKDDQLDWLELVVEGIRA